MKRILQVTVIVLAFVAALGCGATPPVAPTATPFVAGDTPVSSPPGPTATPTTEAAVPPPPVSTDDLVAALQASLPATAFEGVSVLPLTAPASWPPLWAAFTYGMRNYDLDPLVSHLVAIYTHGDAGWQELARLNLDQADPSGANSVMPDYLAAEGVTQVQIAPERVWIEVQAGVGAHGGTYQLLAFDGTTLSAAVSAAGVSPGFGSISDVNQDGTPDVVLDQSDAYVFCYACGVRKVAFQVFAWDEPNQRMLERVIDYFYMGQPQPMRDVVNPAVDMANAGLWVDALPQITAARDLGPSYPECDTMQLGWDYALIKLHADAAEQAAASSPYPLLGNIFYGDYRSAVNLMRPFTPAQIFSPDSPLIVGTPAEGYAESMAEYYIIESAAAALTVKPDLAEAYFLQGWAAYLRDPSRPEIATNLQRAAELAPDDTFFAQCAAYFAP
jgi:hypothetical protein